MKIFNIQTSVVAATLLMAIYSLPSSATPASTPLSVKSGVPPNIMFALSVEFPTAITPAYQDASSYSRSHTYLGYFDEAKCYSYGSGLSYGSVTGWFYPIALATTDLSGIPHECTAGWSGNFLNWVSMAGLDEFRFAMTGGNRVVDLPNSVTYPGGLTVLERSYQTSQGSNFMTKTFTEDGVTTSYLTGTALSIVSRGQGVAMVVTPSGTTTGTATCVGPQLTGTGFNCGALGSHGYDLSNGETANCSTYIGTGTSGDPYRCSVFGNSSGGLPVTTPAGATTGVLSSTSTPGSVTLNCPADSFNTDPPTCTATLSNGATGACESVVGDGTAGSPYTCSGFGLFSGGEGFAITMPLSSSAGGLASTTGTVSAPYTNSNVTCSLDTASPPTTTCSALDGNGTTASCSSYSNVKISGIRYYYCTSFALSGSTDTFVSTSNSTTDYTTVGTRRYYTHYNITNDVNTPTTITYYSTYAGSYGASTYYYSTYSVSLGSGATTYQVRARVCDQSIGALGDAGLEDNCLQYGSTWKPTGVLQENGDSMRFGVTSYFMNDGGLPNSGGGISDIDDAVLRAKAKFVGPDERLPSGVFGTNARTEWNAADGTFINNPDSSDTATMTTPWGTAPANSGVINYINKFGTTAKYYKKYDNIGKLYYETLRYLRHKGPTTDFYNGAKLANSDGFPVITTWDDPVSYSCQKNYIITMGDAHTWCDKRLPGGSFTSNGNAVCNAYTDGNGNSHTSDMGSLPGDTISGTIDGTAVSGTGAATDVVGAMEGMGALATSLTGAGSSASYYMAGLAAWAATNNIRPDIADNSSPMNVKSFIIDVQESKDCSYRKQFWLTAKYGDPAYYSSGEWDASAPWYNSILGNSFSCAYNVPPNYGSSTNYMQWPRNLLRAGDPESMIASVRGALQTIAAEQGDEASLAQSQGTLSTGTGAYIYQASYNTGGWIGDVTAYVIDQTGTVNAQPNWYASHMLPKSAARNIMTFNRTTKAGIPFNLNAGGLGYFDTYQQGLLNLSDGFGADRVKYIRGDMTNEAYLPSPSGATTSNTQANHTWRSRKAVGSACNYGSVPETCPTLADYTNGPTGQLGDVIFSSPVYVAAPSAFISDASYKEFASDHASRPQMVYVGGNDGMLHAYNAAYYIDASTSYLPERCPKMSGGSPVSPQPSTCVASAVTSYSGTEVFGYVPYATYPTLNTLMNQNYSHKFFVDGSPAVADVCVSTSPVYCDGTDDTWKTILVGGLNAGGKGVYALDITDPVVGFDATNVLWEFTDLDDPDLGYTFSKPVIRKLNNKRWAVIFGNGFDSVNAATNPNNNKAYLFILYVDPELDSSHPWVQDTNYFKIELTSPGTPNNASNGLASVRAVDVNQDGMVDYVYGGDRNGNMWKVDLTSDTPGSWDVAFSGDPLFTAKDDAGHLQQITTPPAVVAHPNGGYVVTFGTGSWIDDADKIILSGHPDTLYGIWDKNDGATSSPATGRSVLQRQAVLDTVSLHSDTGASCTEGTANCTTYTVQSSCHPNYTTTATTVSNQSALCPEFVPVYPPTSPVTYTTTALASPSNTSQRLGWYMDFPASGERTHSDPPLIIGSNVQYMSLTPAVDLCAGNTKGFEYDLISWTGEAMTLPLYIIPGNTSGYIMWSPPGGGAAIPVVVSGRSTVGGAANNPITFDVPGDDEVLPTPCTAGNCKMDPNAFVPGWGFIRNLNPSKKRYVKSCYPKQSGGALHCETRLSNEKVDRLLWKQIH